MTKGMGDERLRADPDMKDRKQTGKEIAHEVSSKWDEIDFRKLVRTETDSFRFCKTIGLEGKDYGIRFGNQNMIFVSATVWSLLLSDPDPTARALKIRQFPGLPPLFGGMNW